MSEVTITIAGVGVNEAVIAEQGQTLAQVVSEAQNASLDGGLQARVGGQVVDPATYVPTGDETVVLVPPAIKLG